MNDMTFDVIEWASRGGVGPAREEVEMSTVDTATEADDAATIQAGKDAVDAGIAAEDEAEASQQ